MSKSAPKLMAPQIGIVMGSISDEPIVEKIAAVLDKFKVGYEVSVMSAHRTPDIAAKYSKTAASRGLKVIIAIAGLSAALPGVVAAHCPLPVIGVPVKGGAMDGMDALMSIAQMPPGVPVASVGLNAGANSALLALKIIALSDKAIASGLEKYISQAAKKVLESNSSLKYPSPPSEFLA